MQQVFSVFYHCCLVFLYFFFFFFNDTATTEIYTLSLHDALPISTGEGGECRKGTLLASVCICAIARSRSEEHTSELQSRLHLVCRLLLEKKKNVINTSCPPIQTIRQQPIDDQLLDCPYHRELSTS